jgi:hypothetical protein
MGEELLQPGQKAAPFGFLEVFGDGHHALFVEAALAGLARLVLKELSLDQIPFIIGIGIKLPADSIQFRGAGAQHLGGLFMGK